MRGSNPDEVLIVLDGVPLNIAEGGGVDVSTLPLGDVERVEVYRGTSPLAFGESALGGVVSIVTRTPAANRVTAQAGVGSFGTTYRRRHGGRARRAAAPLRLARTRWGRAGDYAFHNDNNTATNPDDDFIDRRHNNDSLEGNGVFRAALTLTGRRTLNLGLLGFARAQGLPGSQQTIPTVLARFHTARGLATLRYESRDDLGPGGRLSVQAFVEPPARPAAGSRRRGRSARPGDAFTRRRLGRRHRQRVAARSASGGAPRRCWKGAARPTRPSTRLVPSRSGLPARRLVGVAGVELDAAIRPLDLHVIPSIRGRAAGRRGHRA